MYVIPPESEHLQQGDIFPEIPIISLPNDREEFQILRTDGDNQNLLSLEECDTAFLSGSERFVVNSEMVSFMIVTQTCDLQRRGNITICPIYLLDVETNEGHKNSIKGYKVQTKFYLFPTRFFSESYVDLSKMNFVPSSVINIGDRLVSLDLPSQHFLADQIKRVFGRPIQPQPPDYVQE